MGHSMSNQQKEIKFQLKVSDFVEIQLRLMKI